MSSAEEPVQGVPGEGGAPAEGIALCLSGGGYRAMLFHLGALWRLNEAGYLPRLERVSSVSGGSMTNGALALAWDGSTSTRPAWRARFQDALVDPLRKLAGKTIDIWAIVLGILLPGSIGNWYARSLKRNLLGDATLQDIPDRPRFIFNATNLQSAVLWRSRSPTCATTGSARSRRPTLDLATAVAASGAFPPLLSPVTLKPQPTDWTPGSGLDLQRPPFTEKVFLTDGGVYDNLGLETAWKRYRTILVSDGGGHDRRQGGPEGRLDPPDDPRRRRDRQPGARRCASARRSAASGAARGRARTGASAPTSPTTGSPTRCRARRTGRSSSRETPTRLKRWNAGCRSG